MLIARRTAILCISLSSSLSLSLTSLSLTSAAQQKPSPPSPLKEYVKEDAPVLVLEHVRLIDGTGSAPQEDIRIDISGGKITAVQAASAHLPYPPNAKVLDMAGKTVIPGLVGMHEHLFYPTRGVALYGEAPDSAPRLYLAGGVTTARTAGSLEPYTDLELKREIDAGLLPGPKLDVTGPYLEGKGSFAIQMHALADADDAARTVDYWAAEGATSFKAYNYLTADELKARPSTTLTPTGSNSPGIFVPSDSGRQRQWASTTWNMALGWILSSSRGGSRTSVPVFCRI